MAPPRRGINVFMGGAMWAKLLDGMGEGSWISRKVFEEEGFVRAEKLVSNSVRL